MIRPFDPISLLETAYEAQPDMSAWLSAVLGALAIPFDAERSHAAYRIDMQTFDFREFVCTDPSRLEQWRSLVANGAKDPKAQAEMTRADPVGLYTTSEVLSTVEAIHGAKDSYALAAPDGEQNLVVFVALIAERTRVPNDVRPLWRRIALHLAAASRLVRHTKTLEDHNVEAILDPDGRIVEVRGPAQKPDAQQALRDMTRHIDHVRARQGRRDVDGALDMWTGLILGRWSIVDHFDTDGRRFAVARKNDPSRPELAGLSHRARQVAFYAAIGMPNKQIAYALGIAESTVASHLANVLSKLSLETRADLIELAAKSASPPL